MRKAAFACKLFDSLYLRDKQSELPTLMFLADALKFFRYEAFDSLIVTTLKKEIPTVVALAGDWID